jgi:hypothetical protein
MISRVSAYLIFVLLILISGSSYSRDFKIGYTLIRASDPSRGNRVIKLMVYYPADMEGEDVTVASSVRGGFPVLSFGHGYMMPVTSYENLWIGLVPKGYIMVLPISRKGIFPSHSEFGIDLAFAVSQLMAEGNDSSSIFYGRVSGESCLMGHSMGGGAAILGAKYSGGVSSLAVLAPLDTRPSSADAAVSLKIPSLVITGSEDRITLPRKHALPVYHALSSDYKVYISIKGGNHCKMAVKDRLCNFVEKNRPGVSISREEQHEIVNRYLLLWLDYTLKGLPEAGMKFDSLLESDSSVEFLREP